MNSLSKNLVCIVIRNGLSLWVELDRAENMISLLTGLNAPQFVKYENRLINRADVVGIFTAKDMEEHTRRKNGEWECPFDTWHGKSLKCECSWTKQTEERKQQEQEFYDRHGYWPEK